MRKKINYEGWSVLVRVQFSELSDSENTNINFSARPCLFAAVAQEIHLTAIHTAAKIQLITD
jgi:hypothetical protein